MAVGAINNVDGGIDLIESICKKI